MILVMYSSQDKKPLHRNEQRTLDCYVTSTDYKLVQVDIDINERINRACSKHKLTKFKRHCAAAEFLQDADWMLVIDENTAVANPDHCIEEWIDDRVNVLLFEQFTDWDISSSSYLVRNSQWSIQFLHELAQWEFSSTPGKDNFEVYLVHTLLPNGSRDYRECLRHWRTATHFNIYSACARMTLGFQRLWVNKVRIYRKAHGWARAGFVTNNFWCDRDFMLHDWEEESTGRNLWMSPFYDEVDPAVCALREKGWNWLPNKYANASTIQSDFRAFEKMRRRNQPKDKIINEFLEGFEISRCYPECEED
ncbi:hypothetical protein RB195_019707 [Necator americanus]|uniref:Uncharacterized protein n=1 Tax=Necator americanus TaxID=51031 RepID=A0ABR1CG77_NECAM